MMTDNKDTTYSNSLQSTQNNGLTRKHTVSLPGLHARLRNPVAAADPATQLNRIALMLDVSGSMAGEKINKLRESVQVFITACNFKDTAVAIESFGGSCTTHVAPLTVMQPLLLTSIWALSAAGGTPMDLSMRYVLESIAITRGIIVSDGHPQSAERCYDSANDYAAAETPIDCVHIGDSPSGEAVLQRIAEITHGKFIKFTDIASFARSFKYLTPAYYAQLTSGSVTAADLGAKEIK